MDGVTDEPARQIQVSIAKPAVMYTEFVSAEGFVKKPKAFKEKLSFKENERPIVAQIFGYTPKAIYETTRGISRLGFDGIDLNMGCPARQVLLRGGGGGLIGNYDLASKIIEAALSALKGTDIPLSVKTRTGKNEVITKDWISFLCRYPLAEITIHGRLLKRGLAGPVNWEEIRKGAEICHQNNIICFGNGGIKSISEAKEKINTFGLDGVLIGQKALGNPWVFKENYQPTKEEILKVIIDHAREVADFYPPERFVTVLKHFSWYPREFENSKKLKIELLKAKSLKEAEAVIDSWIKQNGVVYGSRTR